MLGLPVVRARKAPDTVTGGLTTARTTGNCEFWGPCPERPLRRRKSSAGKINLVTVSRTHIRVGHLGHAKVLFGAESLGSSFQCVVDCVARYGASPLL